MGKKASSQDCKEVRNTWLKKRGWDPNILQEPQLGEILATLNPGTTSSQTMSIKNQPQQPIDKKFTLTQSLLLQNSTSDAPTPVVATVTNPGDSLNSIQLQTAQPAADPDRAYISIEWGVMGS